jgi:hypothetical protein
LESEVASKEAAQDEYDVLLTEEVVLPIIDWESGGDNYFYDEDAMNQFLKTWKKAPK